MASTKWQCIGECGREFGVGDWECTPGIKHQVAEKTYYIADAPFDPTGHSLRDSRTRIENIPPEKKMPDAHTGQMRILPGGYVEFARGVFTTKDAEQQFWLDQHKAMTTRENWERVYLSAGEKAKIREINIRNKEIEADRKVKEANELLEQVKAKAEKSKEKVRGSV